MTIILTNTKTGIQTPIHNVHAIWKGESRSKLGFKVPALKFAVSQHPDQWDEKVISLKDHDYKVIN